MRSLERRFGTKDENMTGVCGKAGLRGAAAIGVSTDS